MARRSPSRLAKETRNLLCRPRAIDAKKVLIQGRVVAIGMKRPGVAAVDEFDVLSIDFIAGFPVEANAGFSHKAPFAPDVFALSRAQPNEKIVK